jgi:hypothetical protein
MTDCTSEIGASASAATWKPDAPDQVDRRPEQVDGGAQRMAPLDVGCRDGPAELQQEADDRHARGDERHQDAELDGQRHGGPG